MTTVIVSPWMWPIADVPILVFRTGGTLSPGSTSGPGQPRRIATARSW